MSSEDRRKQSRREKSRSATNALVEFFSDAGDFENDEEIKNERVRRERSRRQAAGEPDEMKLPGSRRRPEDRLIYGDERRERREGRTSDGERSRRQRRGNAYAPEDRVGHPGRAIAVVIILMLLIAGVGAMGLYYKKYSYSGERMDLRGYYNISDPEDVPLLVGNEISEVRALQRDGYLFLPLSFVSDNLNDHFYYEKSENQLFYALPDRILRFPEFSNEYYSNEEMMNMETPAWVMNREEPYLEVGFLSGYADFIAEKYENPLRLQLYLDDMQTSQATVLKDTAIRYQGGVKSQILKDLKEGESVLILEELEDWNKVRSSDGIIGYTEKKMLSDVKGGQITIPRVYQEPVFTSLTRDHKINMAWHQVTSTAANDTVYELLGNTKGINVISPTWYFLSDNGGDFTTIASESYVNDMHQRGIEVWALIDNFTNEVDISQILGSYTNRQNLIRQLIPSVLSYGIDGINVDFERVPQAAGEDFAEFIRELSIACRTNGLVLSVDNYVPTASSDFYDRAEQGRVADYVVIMGYDEHYAGSAQAGSVASLGYVLGGIERTISEVPAEKVINGIPFYTRFWRTDGGQVTSEALTMSMAQQSLEKRGITPEWDETTSQYYASFEEDGALCQIWLEEAASIRAKLTVMSQYSLGGVAEWKLGQETPGVWDEITAYMDGSLGVGAAAQIEESPDQQTEAFDEMQQTEGAVEELQTEQVAQ